MRPIEWMTKILDRHDLQKPDGRPLYQYRITDAEFEELRKLIQTSSILGFENISKRLLMWDAVMVFYAAEWWRRYYSGQWGWEGIFDSVGFNINEFSTGARNRLIEVGLQRWQRKVRTLDDRRQFLGTVATEGGLPLRQLSEGGGWLRSLLRPVVKKHLNRGLPVNVLIEAYIEYIPQSYRSVEMRQILEDMVHIVSELRQEHKLEEKSDPIKWLDDNVRHWREQFPLPIDDEAGKSLLSELVDVAARTTISNDTSADSLFEMDRFIRRPELAPQLVARLELPSHIPLGLIENVDKGQQLPGRIELEIVNDLGQSWPWCRGIRTIYKSQDSYKLSGRAFEVVDDAAINSFIVRAKSFGETLFEFPVLSAERLEDDSPWFFKISDNRYEYFGSESQSISAEDAVVYLQKDFSFEVLSENTTFELKNSFRKGALFSLNGAISCKRESEKYTFKTGAEESVFCFELSGSIYKGASNPSQVYLGKPEVYKRNKITGIRKRLDFGKLLAKPVGDTGVWKPFDEVSDGVHELRLVHDDVIKWRKRVGILSSDFSVDIKPSRVSALKGEIHLKACSDHAVSAFSNECIVSTSQDGLRSVVCVQAQENVPPSVLINVLPRLSKREISLTVPFPSSGALLYSPCGECVNVRKPLHLNDLYGYRLRVYDESYILGKTADLRFTLIDNEMSPLELRDIYVDKKINLSGSITELALIDWLGIIQGILGVGYGLDSCVQLSLSISGTEKIKIKFNRYENDLDGVWDEGCVRLDDYSLKHLDIDVLEQAKLKALRLNQPEQADVSLEPIRAGGVSVGSWDFSPEKRDQGHWLIYPDESSSIKFRPLLWINDELLDDGPIFIENIHTLPKATQVKDRTQREGAIRLVLNQMAEDLDHKSWEYLVHLMKKTKHLPLATFDVWRISVSEPRFLAALFVKTGFENVISRLEDELPLIWELVRISDWISALNKYKAKLVSSMAADDGSLDEDDYEAITAILHRKIDGINDLSISMNCLAKILRFEVLEETDRELQIMAMPAEALLKPQVSEELQNLLRRNAESAWPKMLNVQLKRINDDLPDVLQGLVNPPHEFQIPIAYLPLILAWRLNTEEEYGWLGNPVNIFKIEQLKAFDEDWFNAVFNFSSGWISQHSNEFSKVETYA
jgi:hypothetical protein